MILTAAAAPGWLVARGVLPPGEHAAEALGGGVSGEVVRVTAADGRRVIAKQALPRLRVADEWLAPQRRSLTEARALALAATLVPGAVPAVLDVDDDACAFALDHAPDGWTTWGDEIAAGRVHATAGAWAGDVLGRIHARTAGDPAVAAAFDDREAFEALRIDPFFRTTARRRPDLAPLLAPCIADLERRRTCLVHGDYAPKNVLLAPAGGGWVLDWEVAHVGDPAFDLGFMLSFLVLPAVRWPLLAPELLVAAEGFLAAYAATVPAAVAPTPQRTWLHAACHVLARVEGKSPAQFLDEGARARARAVGESLLVEPPATAAAAWERL